MKHDGDLLLMHSSIDCRCKMADSPMGQTGRFHSHNGYEIILVTGGAADLYTENGGRRLRRGDLICIPAYEFHREELVAEEKYERTVINILDKLLLTKSSAQTNLEQCFLHPPGTRPNMVHLTEERMKNICSWSEELEKIIEGGG